MVVNDRCGGRGVVGYEVTRSVWGALERERLAITNTSNDPLNLYTSQKAQMRQRWGVLNHPQLGPCVHPLSIGRRDSNAET